MAITGGDLRRHEAVGRSRDTGRYGDARTGRAVWRSRGGQDGARTSRQLETGTDLISNSEYPKRGVVSRKEKTNATSHGVLRASDERYVLHSAARARRMLTEQRLTED